MAFSRRNRQGGGFVWRARTQGCAMLLALAVVGLGGTVGCGDKSENGVARINPRSTPFLTGVPVPEGFSLVDRSTEDYESGGRRWARHAYRGSAEQLAVRNFYREQMPLLGWTLVSDQNVKGVMSIRFENPDEACTIQIERENFLFMNRCTVQVILMPLSRVSQEQQPPPRRPVP